MVTSPRVRMSRLPRSLRRQQGAAVVYALGALVSGLAASALAIDIGQLYYAQRDLQKMASDAALDAAQAQSGCYSTLGQPGTIDAATMAMNTALSRDIPFTLLDGSGSQPALADLQRDYGSGVATLEYGTVSLNPDFSGIVTRTFKPLPATNPAVDAVRVNLARNSPTLLVPFITGGDAASGGSVLLRASAAAQQAPVASFRLGSQIASLNLNLICGLVSSNPTACSKINIGNSSTLVNATVTLDQLAVAAGVGDSGQLLRLNQSLNEQLQTIIDALTTSGQTVAASQLALIAAFVDPARESGLGAGLGIPDPDTGPLVGALPINVVDILNSLAINSAHGLYPIQLPVAINFPGITGSVFLDLGGTDADSQNDRTEPENRTAPGRSGRDAQGNWRTSATTQKLKLLVRLTIDSNLLPVLSAIPLNAAKLKLGLDVTAANATSVLSAVRCAAPLSGRTQPRVEIDTTVDSGTVVLGTYNNPSDPITQGPGSLVAVGGNLLTINLQDRITQTFTPVPEKTVMFDGPFDDLVNHPKQETVGAAGVTLTPVVNSLLSQLGANLSGKVTLPIVGSIPIPVSTLTSNLATVTNLVTPTIDGLLTSLGLTVDGATVTMTGFLPGTSAALVSNGSPVLFTRAKPVYEVNQDPPLNPINTAKNTR